MTEKDYYKKNSHGELVHNLEMEKKIGRKLKSYEVVHHIDLVKSNDSPENLYLCKCRGIHHIIHKQFRSLGRKITLEFLRQGIIIFDLNKEIYQINKTEFKKLFNIDKKKISDLLKKLSLTSKELEDIEKRKNYSFEKAINRKEEKLDRSEYDQIRKAISY